MFLADPLFGQGQNSSTERPLVRLREPLYVYGQTSDESFEHGHCSGERIIAACVEFEMRYVLRTTALSS